MKRVPFVKAQQEDQEFRPERREKTRKPRRSSVEGREVKEFYESVVGETSAAEAAAREERGNSETEVRKERSKSGKRPTTSKHRRKRSVDAKEDWRRRNKTVKDGDDWTRAKTEAANQIPRIATRAEVALNARLRKGSRDFLQSAQLGHLNTVKLHLERGLDLDVTDQYGWTALHCSAFEGHGETVQLLLQSGANVSHADNQGQTALTVAESAFRSNKDADSAEKRKKVAQVCQMLRDFMNGKEDWGMDRIKTEQTSEAFFCETCGREFSDTTRKKHETSTIHLFNNNPKDRRGTFYHLPENNKGFRLMVQSGWDRDKGLGPEGREGLKFPVKTFLKRDRLGLGNPKPGPAKVTHFGPHDTEAVKRPKRPWDETTQKRTVRNATLSKKQRAKQLSKEQRKEMNYRLEFSMDN